MKAAHLNPQSATYWQKLAALYAPGAPLRFDLVAWLFLRGMGLVYLAAFVSFGIQAQGLIGSGGILPLPSFLAAAHHQLGALGYWLIPTLFWLDPGNLAIAGVCWAGAALALLLTFNILPRLSLVFLYVLYLSLFYAGQVFMSFQWDLLVLEAGFLAFVLSVAPKPGIWLLRWLLFRFMFLSGSVKLLSRDPSWANLSALSYHFQTQPLPTPLAWYAHHLPPDVLVVGTAGTFAVELVLPFLIFFPRPFRFAAGFGILLLETLIFLTGNYNFFNLLTMLLCLPLFDDAAVQKLMPHRLQAWLQEHARPIRPKKTVSRIAVALALLIALVGGAQLYATYGGRVPPAIAWIGDSIEPLRIVNTYGLFAVMTTKRPEIIVEGSDDGVDWKEYGFKYKPGDVDRPPLWNIPHQPRLDWQMWFAALGTASQNPWFSRFLQRLLENAPDVTALLGDNPFAPPRSPPRYVRALLYDYRFSSPAEKGSTGAWWVRQPLGIYYPAIGLQPE
jgi:hypothetical protein